MSYKAILVTLIAACLTGCVTASNTLSDQDVATLRLTGVDVRFAPDAFVSWGDGERAFAASRGQPATESDTLAKTPEGRAYIRNIIAGKLKGAIERRLAGSLNGSRAVRVEVVVKQVAIASAIQRIIIGGNHMMTADVTLVDARTGASLLPYAGQTTQAIAGQGIAGTMIDAAVAPDPIDRVVGNYADRYGDWLLCRDAVAAGIAAGRQ